MEDFKTRLVEEAKQLMEKLEKLREFIKSNKFPLLSSTNQSLLKIQCTAMATYLECLSARIDLLIK